MSKKDANKPKGRMSSYVYFVQCCREEHKKKHPGENVVFAEFTKKCAQKWKDISGKEKRRFEEMAEKDKARYEREMANYVPPAGTTVRGTKKRTKDPNAPKRALSAFFLFCNDERPKVRKEHGDYTVAEVAKELGKRWGKVTDRTKYEKQAEQEKKKYEIAMAAYKAGLGSPQKKAAPSRSPAKKPKVEESEEEDEDDDEEDDDNDEDDE